MKRNDYNPFGMVQPGRKFASVAGYRFGFNGKENDNDVKGDGNQQDYGSRIYDPRVGRFLSVDPIATNFPWFSPYQFAGNSPIQAIDLDGLEPEWMITEKGKVTKPMMTLLNAAYNYRYSGMVATKWVNFKTPYSANTILYWVLHNKEKVNYWKDRNYNKWVDFWINLVPHEQKHRNDYTVFGNILFGTIYLFTSTWELVTTGKFYSDKTFFESRAYGLEPSILTLMNMENGLAIKTLESKALSDEEKSEVLAYIGTAFQLDQAVNNLIDIKGNANEDGNISRKERKKIAKAEKRVQELADRAEQLNTDKVKEVKEMMKNVERKPVEMPKKEDKEEQTKHYEEQHPKKN